MARLKKGLLGGISGTLGNIEGYILNGQQIIRTRRAKSSKPPTEKQLACQQKLKIVNEFIGAFLEFVRTGFTYARRAETHSAHNAATAWQLRNAITGEYPNLTINYPKARVTEGPMDTQGINAAATIKNYKLTFTWTPDLSYAHSNDNVMLLAYSSDLNEAVYKLRGAKRSIGTDELILSDNSWEVGIEVHSYLSFIAENGTRCTNSIYIGKFNVQ